MYIVSHYMEITKLTKQIDIEKDTVKLEIEVQLSRPKGYRGLDVFPDTSIQNALTALGRMYKMKQGKIKKSNSI